MAQVSPHTELLTSGSHKSSGVLDQHSPERPKATNSPEGPTPNRSHRICSGSDDEMGSMEASTAPENGSAAGGGAGGTGCNGAGAASNGGGMERRLRSSAASASWAAHLPLEVGTRVMCRWRDQKLHPVKVIERRKGSTSSSPSTTSTTSTTPARGAGFASTTGKQCEPSLSVE